MMDFVPTTSESRKCQECMDVPTPKLISDDKVLPQYLCQWYNSYEDAKLSLHNLEKSTATKLRRKAFNKYDSSKSKICWDESNCPYIIVETEYFDMLMQKYKSPHFAVFKGKLRACLSKVIKFLQYKSSTGFTSHYKQSTSRAIRKFICTSDPTPAMEHVYLLKIPILSTCQTQEQNVSNDEIITHHKWTTVNEVGKAIEEFEILNSTKYINYCNWTVDLLNCKVYFDDELIPYVVTKTTVLQCQHGKDYNKEKNDRRHQDVPFQLVDHPRTTKKNLSIQGSKKMDCKAKIFVKEAIRFPQHKSSAEDFFQTKMAITKALLKHDENLVKVSACNIIFPANEDHSGHVLGEAAGFLQSIDKRLIAKIDKMVNDDGICSVQEIKRGLKSFVTFELFKHKELPSELNRRFFPTIKDIQNHFHKSFTKHRLSKIDQENVQMLVDRWQQDAKPGDKILFRPYVACVNSTTTVSADFDSCPIIQSKQSLLFLHQFAWQRRLLIRYGQDICLLDATYKTSKYALPLFFLCVKTNVGYQVVASFITQNERQADIEEALCVLKEWCPQWNPNYFMTDKCEAEINAIETVFTDCRVLICDFHREQAWERWLKKTENIDGDLRNTVLYLIRAIANAENEKSYISALQTLRINKIWLNNIKLQKYFENVWLKEKERWVWFYRADRIKVLIRTNNGVERQNRVLKECHLKFRTDKSLSGLVTIIHKDFLPQSRQRYEEKNLRSSSSYRKYNTAIPVYLQNRPKKIVKHCIKRMTESESLSSHKILRSGNIFQVASEVTNMNYTIQFGSESEFPKCSCTDFRQHFLPCKHMFAIFKKYGDFSWDSLPNWYSDSVYLTLDYDIVGRIAAPTDNADTPAILLSVNKGREDDENANFSQVNSDMPQTQNDDKPTQKSIKEIANTLKELTELLYDVRSQKALDLVKKDLLALNDDALQKFFFFQQQIAQLCILQLQ